MHPELLQILKAMNAQQILKAITEAKTGSKTVYSTQVPIITKKETCKQLDWFIQLVEETCIKKK